MNLAAVAAAGREKGDRFLQRLITEEYHALMLFGLIFGTLIAFGRTSLCGFISFDDPSYIYQNPHIVNGLSWNNVCWAFTTLHGDTSYWHPLTWISHMLDCHFFGLRPAFHHVNNLMIHLATVLVFFYLLVQATGRHGLAFFAAALFAWHPLRVESVVWISERKDLLCGLFYFATLLAYIYYVLSRKKWSYLAAFFLYLLALLSKPMAISMPVILLLIDYWPLRRGNLVPVADQLATIAPITRPRPHAPSWFTRVHWLDKIPFLIASIVISCITIKAQADCHAMASLDDLSLFSRVGNAMIGYWFYLWKSLWPTGLVLFYLHPGHWPATLVVLSSLFIVLVTAFVLIQSRQYPCLLMAWLWFIITLLPVSGLVQVGRQSFADRYTYIPMAGLGVGIVWGLYHGLLVPTPFKRRVQVWGGLLVLLCLMGLTFHQVKYWRNSTTVWNRTLQIQPNHYIAHVNLANELANRGQPEAAIHHFAQASELRPFWDVPLLGLAKLMLLTTNSAQAEMLCTRVLEMNTSNGSAFFYRDHARVDLEKPLGAIHDLQRALAFLKDDPNVYEKLAWIYATWNDSAIRNGTEAKRLATKACDLTQWKSARMLDTLAASYAECQEFTEAERFAKAAMDWAAGAGLLGYRKEIEQRREKYHHHLPYRAAPVSLNVDRHALLKR